MDPQIKTFYTDDVQQSLFARYKLTAADLSLLDGFESFIYEFERDGKPYILRVSHSQHRSPELIQGETEWIYYLAKHGLNVASPAPDLSGRLVETMETEDGIFSAVAFHKVPGSHASADDWNSTAMISQLGHLVGKMHALTQDFEPSDPEFERYTWDEDIADTLKMLKSSLPKEDAPLITYYTQMVQQAHTFSRGIDEYGLIHFDVHGGNFYVDDSKTIWLFDFDDCCYNWFANDIAMVFFYAAPLPCDTPEKIEIARQRFEAFLQAYQQENAFDPAWLEQIPVFLTLREIDLYAAVKRDIPESEYDGWCERYMTNRRENLMARKPYIQLDFTKLNWKGSR